MNNHIQLIGNTGMDPQITNFESGAKKVKFSLATSERRKNAMGEYESITIWHSAYAWGTMAENIVSHVKKGSKLLVTGALRKRSFLSKKGERRNITEIEVKQLKKF